MSFTVAQHDLSGWINKPAMIFVEYITPNDQFEILENKENLTNISGTDKKNLTDYLKEFVKNNNMKYYSDVHIVTKEIYPEHYVHLSNKNKDNREKKFIFYEKVSTMKSLINTVKNGWHNYLNLILGLSFDGEYQRLQVITLSSCAVISFLIYLGDNSLSGLLAFCDGLPLPRAITNHPISVGVLSSGMIIGKFFIYVTPMTFLNKYLGLFAVIPNVMFLRSIVDK